MVTQLERHPLTVESKKLLTAEQQRAASLVLGQAFEKDFFMTYMLPDANTRVQRLTKLFLPLIRCSQRYGAVDIAPGGGGVLAWAPGKVFSGPIKFLELFRSGMLWVPLSLGLSAFNRLKVHDDVCEHALIKHAPKDFAYIWAVGVRPDQAGKGLGKQLIQSALNEMRHQGYTTCWLRTENPSNVGLYKHLGFQQVHTEIPSGSGQQYWLMYQTL